MTKDWRPWLPEGLAQRPDVRAELARVVDGWAQAWFAPARLSAPDFGRPAAEDAPAQPISIVVAANDLLQLAALAAEVSDAPDALTGADRTLLRGLGEAMTADLRRRLEDRTGPAAGDGGGERLEIRLGARGARPSLSVVIAGSALVGMAKGLMPPPPLGAAPLTGVAQCLTETSLTVEAMLGRANLSFGDLSGLAVGDVLVLDTALDGLLDLRLVGSDSVLARARFNPSEDQLTLAVSR